MQAELIGGAVAFLLTVIVLGYLFAGTYGLFRLVMYGFVGITAGYVGAVAWYNVLWPRLVWPLLNGHLSPLDWVPFVLAVLLFARLFPRWGRIANFPLAFLVGVGAAAAIGGAVLGTLLPQAWASIEAVDWRTATAPAARWEVLINGTVILVGTVSTLAYFHFGARRAGRGEARPHRVIQGLGGLGQAFIAVAFGTLFAGVFMAALTALVERITFLWHFMVEVLWQFLR